MQLFHVFPLSEWGIRDRETPSTAPSILEHRAERMTSEIEAHDPTLVDTVERKEISPWNVPGRSTSSESKS